MFAVLHVLGLMLAFFAITFVMPMVCSLLAGDGMFADFAAAAGLNVLLGLALALAIGIVIGALPALRGMRLNIVDALAGR